MERFEATAIIMAGGQSKRMGTDKGQLQFKGKSFVENLVETLKDSFAELLISANDTDAYAHLGVPVVPDTLVNAGPLSGLAAALGASNHELNFVVSCDSPVVVFPVVNRLLGGMEGYDCAVVMGDGGQLEPLFAVYRKSLLPRLEAQLQAEKRSMHAFLSQCRMKAVSVRKGTLVNINTPEEYQEFLDTHA